MTEDARARSFSERVVTLFVTHVLTAGIGIVNAFLFARLLGPAAKGDYYLIVLPTATAMVLVQLGLPAALGFYTARGRTAGIVRKAIALSTALSLAALALVVVLLPWLQETFLKGLELGQILFALTTIPMLVITTFTTSIVIALRAVRSYSATMLARSLASTVFLVLLLGVLGFGLPGAITTYVVASLIGMVGMWASATRATAAIREASSVTYRQLFRYGLPLYPASLTAFFSYRADVFLLAALLPDASAALGYYSMAVTLAEMVFFLPNAVSSVFLPHVAGSAREDADRHVLVVCRVTLILTGLAALALAPVGTILISALLPAFVPALPALYVLLPGVVALSVTKVVSEYTSGLGLTAIASVVNVLAFAVNIVANLILIPPFGFVGAAAASLVSYSLSSIVITLIAARLAHASLLSFWIPRPSDVRFVITMTAALTRRLLTQVAPSRDARG